MFFRRRKKETNDNPPYLIIGLGNPGPEYKSNRHNVGFMVLDTLAEGLETKFGKMQGDALIAQVNHDEHRLILAKPRTFMNKSGIAVGQLQRFYKTPSEKLIIVYDDVDLPFESLRLRAEGGSAGHNGMKSIIERLGSQEFARLRVGVGRPKGRMRTPDHVLQDFSREEKEALPFVLRRAAEAVEGWVHEGITTAMNKYNSRKDEDGD